MKKVIYPLALLFILSCSKSKTPIATKCYKCTAISQGTTYNEKVCTDGSPYDKLPKQDSGGNLGWICTEQ